jgi:hypothetical protein
MVSQNGHIQKPSKNGQKVYSKNQKRTTLVFWCTAIQTPVSQEECSSNICLFPFLEALNG